jgi:hypothetical protein
MGGRPGANALEKIKSRLNAKVAMDGLEQFVITDRI